MAVTTLLDIAKANAADPVVGLIEEVVTYAPEVMYGAARTIRGLNYRTLVRTALPGVAFRNANEGSALTKSTWENRLIECYTLNPRWECDKAVADRYEDGAAAFVALEADGVMKASMIHLGSQFYYGTANDSKGFPGLVAAYDSSAMEVDAGGTAANTGSSVWAVKFGPQAVQWVYGNGGSLEMSELDTQRVLDASNNPYTAYVQELLAYPGLQVGNKYAIGRIRDLTADTGKGLTDALIAQLLEKFPVGYKPDYLFMNRRSLRQLQSSRTATNPTGAPAPFPSESFGIQIIVTDSITSTEALS
jgi:hypothetical protein